MTRRERELEEIKQALEASAKIDPLERADRLIELGLVDTEGRVLHPAMPDPAEPAKNRRE